MIVPGRDMTRPLSTFPIALTGIIALNVLVFMLEVAAGEAFIERWAMTPNDVTQGHHLETLLTSMFMHASLLHLVGNMVFLVAFGEQLEANYLGPVRFLIFYLLCGFAADALQIAVDPTSTVPNVGASGAIAGVMGGFIIVFPGDQIQAWVLSFLGLVPTRISAGVFIGLWFLLQLISGFGSLAETSVSEGGVAYFAHIGGFIAGALLIIPMGIGLREQET
jgi:membrane associated rhomboid family serine protease